MVSSEKLRVSEENQGGGCWWKWPTFWEKTKCS